MKKSIEYDREIRGTFVTVTCTDFDGDESVGIGIGPETVYAVDDGGNDFPLTDEEVEKFTIEAGKDYFDDGYDD